MAISPSQLLLPFKPHHHHHPLLLAPVLFGPKCHQSKRGDPYHHHHHITTNKLHPTRRHVITETTTEPLTEERKDELQKRDQAGESLAVAPGVAEIWRELHGEKDWEGLMDPLNPLLRSELIRYGAMTQACYDSYDYDTFSRSCGSCRYLRGEFFKRLGMEDCGYEVTRYLYATSDIKMPKFIKKSRHPQAWSELANWIGYVAVSDDKTSKLLGRRDIVIAWRGTVTRLEWLEDLKDFLRPVSSSKIPCPDPNVMAESGFLDLYTDKNSNCRFCKYSAREQILAEVRKLVEKYSNEELSITVMGHSLGSALAVLNGYDIVETGVNVGPDGRTVPVCVYSFAGPRVGNFQFKGRVEGLLGLKVLRVLNIHDVVPKSPGFFLNENLPSAILKMLEWFPWIYMHLGVKLVLDSRDSPYLRPEFDPGNFHNLEAHLHLLDGYQGKGRKFETTTGRDPALVNKSCDFLIDKLTVPPSWRIDENKGMVRSGDRWVLPEPPEHDDHPTDTHHHLTKLGLVSDN